MPQMAPLLWFNLFTFFSITFMLFFIMNYFLAPYNKIKPTSKTQKTKKLNWKW
uniref:ATP synthase complex subunit 8 n=1 Tax=Typhlatya arfeae TaxID=1173211 RepID=A0A1Z2R7B3_9EUCA|nr:ATP synthase F0 subunit 8 [Typhlatya arfeae]ASA39596.1 ATP synthase F0 subunit 8 [Typhlatya arfeae]